MAQDIKLNGVTFRGVDMLRVPLADDSGSAVYKDASNLVSPIDIKGIFAGTVTEIDDINGEIDGAVGTRVLNNNDSLLSLILPAATSMANEAARYCDNLLYVKMDNCVTLNYRAFRDCPKLKEVDFPKLNTLGQEAFAYCYALKDTNFPLVETVGIDAFYNDNTVEALSFPALKTLNTRAFYGCSKLESLNMPNLLTINANDVFSGCTALKSVSFPKLTTVSGEYMFRNSYVENFTFPLLTALCYRMAREAKGVKQVTLAECLTINDQAFCYCSTLQFVTAPKATSIGADAFNGCSKIESVSFPALQSIAANAFVNCSLLAALVLSNENRIVTLSNVNALSGTPIASGTGFVYVPLKLVDYYKKASNWVTYKDQIKSKESKDDNTAIDYAISIVRESNCKPLCRYVTSKGTYNGRDRTVLGAKASDSIAYTISSPGYVTMTGTKSVSDEETDITIDASSMVADENFNGISILNCDFTKQEPDYCNYATLSYGNYSDYYLKASENGMGEFSGSKYFSATVSVPELTGLTNPVFILEMLAIFDENATRSAIYTMGSNGDGGGVSLGCDSINRWNGSANRITTFAENIIGEHHVALATDATYTYVFVDGELVNTVSDTAFFNQLKASALKIGRHQSDSSNYFKGRIKQVALTVRDLDDPTDAADYFLLDIPESD